MARAPTEAQHLHMLAHKAEYLRLAVEAGRDTRGWLERERAAVVWLLGLLEETALAPALAEARRMVAERPPRLK